VLAQQRQQVELLWPQDPLGARQALLEVCLWRIQALQCTPAAATNHQRQQ
jgi:hypothetical protein